MLTTKQKYDKKRYQERKDEIRGRSKVWYENNKHRAIERIKKWNNENPGRNNIASAKYRKRNPLKRKEIAKKYAQRPEVKLKQREYGRRQREKLGKDGMRRERLWYKYRITIEQYDAMFNSQGGRCALCGELGVLIVDHCHKTEKIRALVHPKCNTGIGMFGDNSSKLRLAAQYLDFHKK